MTELCSAGSADDTPCTNDATTETRSGWPACEGHEPILDLLDIAYGYYLAEVLLGEAIDKARGLGEESASPGSATEESAATLLESARDEARREYRLVVQEMDALEPERG